MSFIDYSNTKIITIGYTRNKTGNLTDIKESFLRKKHRFRKFFEPSTEYVKFENSIQDTLLKVDEDVKIEMSSISIPNWMIEHNEITALMTKLEKTSSEQKKLISQKKLQSFLKSSHLDSQISKLFEQFTILLKSCHEKIQNFANNNKKFSATVSEDQIYSNIEKSLKIRMSEIMQESYKIQRQYRDLYKKSEFFDDVERLDEEPDENQQMQDQAYDQEKLKEIEKVAKSMETLASLFTQMQTYVISQGTLVDNIDYNLDKAEGWVQKGNKTLGDTHKKLTKSGCAEKIIRILIGLIITFCILLVIKYAKS